MQPKSQYVFLIYSCYMYVNVVQHMSWLSFLFLSCYLFLHSNTLPLCETSSTLPETQSRGSLTIQCDPSSQDPVLQTGPGLPPLAHQTGPYQTAAWMQSGGTAAAHLTPGMTLQRQGTIHHIIPN